MSFPQCTQCRGPSDGRGPCCHPQPLPWGITHPSDPHIWLGGKRRAVIRQGQGINSYKSCWAESSSIQLLPTPPEPATLLPPALLPSSLMCLPSLDTGFASPLALPPKTAGTKLCFVPQPPQAHGQMLSTVSVVSQGKCNLSREDSWKSGKHFGRAIFTKRG